MQCNCLCWRLTYHILLLFKSKLLSLLSNGNPSSLRISFSDISIVSNWSWKRRKLMTLLLYSAYKLRLMGLYMYESCSIQLKPNVRGAYTQIEVTGPRKQELIKFWNLSDNFVMGSIWLDQEKSKKCGAKLT